MDDDSLFDAFDEVGTADGSSPDAPVAKRARTDVVVKPSAQSLTAAALAAAGGTEAAAAYLTKQASGAATALPAARDEASAPAPEEVESTGKACKHEVGMPYGEEPTADMIALTVPEGRVPSRTYKFELDPFQKAAVACIEREESVLVSAHTSAGKTVCAEYAIATSLRDSQRVLYTAPIKVRRIIFRRCVRSHRSTPERPGASPRSPPRGPPPHRRAACPAVLGSAVAASTGPLMRRRAHAPLMPRPGARSARRRSRIKSTASSRRSLATWG